MGDLQINKVIGRDLVRMELGKRPEEYSFKPGPLMSGTPNHKALDRAFRVRMAARYREDRLGDCVKDLVDFLEFQARNGHMAVGKITEQTTASHEHHWLLAMMAALSAAREIDAIRLLAAIRSWCRTHWAILRDGCAKNGFVILPGARSASRVTGLAEPHSVYRDAWLSIVSHKPLTRQQAHFCNKPLNAQSLDTAGCQMARILAGCDENFGGEPHAGDQPILAAPMLIYVFQDGHIAFATALPESGAIDCCTEAWADYRTGKYGGRGRNPVATPDFPGAPVREIRYRGPN